MAAEATSSLLSDPQDPTPPHGHAPPDSESVAERQRGDAAPMEAAEPLDPIPGIYFPEGTDWYVVGGPDLDDTTIPASIMVFPGPRPRRMDRTRA